MVERVGSTVEVMEEILGILKENPKAHDLWREFTETKPVIGILDMASDTDYPCPCLLSIRDKMAAL